MTPERCIREALIRALTWKHEIVVTELGAVRFQDAGSPPLRAFLEAEEFDVAVVVARHQQR